MPNFFQLYNDYVKDTEPPPNYHAWSAIAAISALLGKKCQIPQGHFTVFPNLYIVLVGDPGMRKSSAMNIAKRLTRLVETVPVAADSGSREGLLDDMAKNKVIAHQNGRDISYWQSAAFVTEMQEFLGGKHINSAMVGFLTAIWDEAIYKERTRKGGEVVINNPYFTFLGCCTPNWMNEKLKQDVITDGFSRRTIFALENELNTLNPWPESTPQQLETLAMLASEAHRIHAVNGPFELSKEARAVYEKSYRDMREEAKQYSEKVQNYFTSKHILVLKIAMCISAGLDSQRYISSEVIQMALKFLSQSERALNVVFAGVGRNELKALLDKGLQRIRSAGEKGMTLDEFIYSSFDDMRRDEAKEVWEVLMQGKQVATADLSHAQEAPRVRAASLNPLPPALNLIQLVSRLEPRRETKMESTQVFVTANHLAPETATLLARQKEWKDQTNTGLLLRGKLSLSGGARQTPSTKQASSPDPETPATGSLSNPPSPHDSASPQQS